MDRFLYLIVSYYKNTMDKELLIVGLDPGITTGYAVLNLKGEIIKLKSSKRLTLSNVIDEIIEVGKVLIVGTDVKYTPNYIEKFASKFGAKVIHPDDDMKVGFKTRLTENYKVNDSHQRDSLAAALNAYKEICPLLRRVSEGLKKEGKEHLYNQVIELVIRGLSISDAISRLESKPVEEKHRKKLKSKFKRSFRIFEENLMLKKRNEELSKEINLLNNKIQNLENSITRSIEEKTKKILDLKDKKILILNKQIESYKKETQVLNNKLSEIKNLILDKKDKIIVKKYNTLGLHEFENMNIIDNIIYVEDLNIFSEKTFDIINNKVTTIIYNKGNKDILKKPFNFTDKNKLSIIEKEDFILADKNEIDKEKNKNDILNKIIEEYKEDRSSLLNNPS